MTPAQRKDIMKALAGSDVDRLTPAERILTGEALDRLLAAGWRVVREPDEERVARALWHDIYPHPTWNWDDPEACSKEEKNRYRRKARAAIAAIMDDEAEPEPTEAMRKADELHHQLTSKGGE